MIEVFFTETEYYICKMIGELRYAQTSKVCAEQRQSLIDPTAISVDGVLSEYLVAKHKKWFFDLNCDVRKFDADLIAPTGHKIDVKCTRRIDGDMNVRHTHKTKNYDYYVLVELKERSGIIIGIADRNTVVNDANLSIGSVTGQPYYKVPRTKLKPWK